MYIETRTAIFIASTSGVSHRRNASAQDQEHVEPISMHSNRRERPANAEYHV